MDPPERYAYMFTAGGRRLLFVRNYGSGTRAQLVHDIDSGQNLIRKVTTFRLVPARAQDDSDPNWRPKSPREVSILHTIKHTFKPPEPDLTPYIPHCYGYEYIKSTSTDKLGRLKYHSISYWKLYNGGSLHSRWLKKDSILPPAVAVARMIRQVLTTLHYLCTAGKTPLYHSDLHFGNIWAHWTDTSPLPDFYVGDFADAAFDDPRIRDLSHGEGLLHPRSVDDLYRFGCNLELLIDSLAQKRGLDQRVRALSGLVEGIDNLVRSWKHNADDPDVPPDLKGLIYSAEELERRWGPGGDEDETGTEEYVRFVTEERRVAKGVEAEKGLVVARDSVKAALETSCTSTDGESMVPMAVHGPWQLVRADTWVPVEGAGVTHHRPNGRNGRDGGVDVSNTLVRPTMFDDGYLEAYGNGEVDDGPYTPLFQSFPRHEEEPQPSNRFRVKGEDDKLPMDAHPQDPADPFPAWLWAAPDDPLSFLKSPHGLRRPRVLRDLRWCSWPSEDEPDFNVKDMFHPENLRYEDLACFDWDQFYRRCEARFSKIRKAYNQRKTSLIIEYMERLYAKQHEVEELPPAGPEMFEERCRRWHILVHGRHCVCSVWADDVEGILRRERTGRFMTGIKAANFSLEDPELT